MHFEAYILNEPFYTNPKANQSMTDPCKQRYGNVFHRLRYKLRHQLEYRPVLCILDFVYTFHARLVLELKRIESGFTFVVIRMNLFKFYHAICSMAREFVHDQQVPSSMLNQLEEHQWLLASNYPINYSEWFLQLILLHP